MATYPAALRASSDSREKRLSGRQVDRATNGAVKARKLFDTQKKSFTIVHRLISAADKATLEAFFTTNELAPFDFVWAGDGLTYSCIFGDDIEYKGSNQTRWDATVQLVQV